MCAREGVERERQFKPLAEVIGRGRNYGNTRENKEKLVMNVLF
jgi:hypothetical protein